MPRAAASTSFHGRSLFNLSRLSTARLLPSFNLPVPLFSLLFSPVLVYIHTFPPLKWLFLPVIGLFQSTDSFQTFLTSIIFFLLRLHLLNINITSSSFSSFDSVTPFLFPPSADLFQDNTELSSLLLVLDVRRLLLFYTVDVLLFLHIGLICMLKLYQ